MKVPFFEVRLSADQKIGLEATFRRVLDSGQYILGPEVEAFESECAAYLSAKHCIGVSSGTDALLVSLTALGIGPGKIVQVPTFTFAATAMGVERLGARVQFTDVHDDDLTMDARECVANLTIPVDLFGSASWVRGDDVIVDCAQSFGSFTGVGNLQAACFSFFPTKNLAAFGDGGLVATNSDDLAKKIRAIRNHGSHQRYEHLTLGGNFRLDALQAALLRVRLRHLPYDLQARRIAANFYHRYFTSENLPIRLPQQPFYGVPNQFVIRVPTDRATPSLPSQRDALRAFLSERGIGTEIYYPKPLHVQPCFAHLGYSEGDFPVAEKAAKEVLALPIFPGITEEEQSAVCAEISEFFD